MKIGVLGTGNVGATIGSRLHDAKHQVKFAAKHPEHAEDLAKKLGRPASAGTVDEAIEFGEVVLLAMPLGALPALASSVGDMLRGKIVIDAENPFPQRDGAAAREATASGRGTGCWTASLLPGARVVRAFNTIPMAMIRKGTKLDGGRVAVPIAGDDRAAADIVAGLARDAGFDPVLVGGLERATQFEPGTPLFGSLHSADELRKMLGATT